MLLFHPFDVFEPFSIGPIGYDWIPQPPPSPYLSPQQLYVSDGSGGYEALQVSDGAGWADLHVSQPNLLHVSDGASGYHPFQVSDGSGGYEDFELITKPDTFTYFEV